MFARCLFRDDQVVVLKQHAIIHHFCSKITSPQHAMSTSKGNILKTNSPNAMKFGMCTIETLQFHKMLDLSMGSSFIAVECFTPLCSLQNQKSAMCHDYVKQQDLKDEQSKCNKIRHAYPRHITVLHKLVLSMWEQVY